MRWKVGEEMTPGGRRGTSFSSEKSSCSSSRKMVSWEQNPREEREGNEERREKPPTVGVQHHRLPAPQLSSPLSSERGVSTIVFFHLAQHVIIIFVTCPWPCLSSSSDSSPSSLPCTPSYFECQETSHPDDAWLTS